MGRQKNKVVVVSGNGNNVATDGNGTTVTTADGNTVTTSSDDSSVVVVNGRVFINGREL